MTKTESYTGLGKRLRTVVVLAFLLAFFICFNIFSGMGQSYSVDVGPGLCQFTNVVEIVRCKDSKDGTCILVRYVEGGTTNDFHAWGVSLIVTTNTTKHKPHR